MGYDLGISKIITSSFTHTIQKKAHTRPAALCAPSSGFRQCPVPGHCRIGFMLTVGKSLSHCSSLLTPIHDDNLVNLLGPVLILACLGLRF